ncbi:recombination regulator RecX [Streptococcus sp. sy010]|uniref:recombination regulator RecX n=1 Tax=Streptococcus sp. sy010 TaxID=2600148 RepID=UPI0011B6946E|nr:recombination regulator RecX [Streptococcus sp. sy010]TWT16344.1 recombination regulator RecX [Streptococcus sp. sy010]
MKITKLEKKKRLYLLELDETEKLYITEDSLVRFMLSKGKELNQDEINKLKDYNQFSLGRGLALYYLSFSQRTTAQVKTYLHKYDIDEVASQKIINYLTQENFLNDRTYTKHYIEQQNQHGDKGPYVITQKLLQKGIDKEIIEDELEAIDFSASLEKLANKLAKKYSHRLPTKALEQKIIQLIINRGFAYAQAQEALLTLDLTSNTEDELELLYTELDKQYRKLAKRYDGYQLHQKLYQNLFRKGYQSQDIQTVLKDYK